MGEQVTASFFGPSQIRKNVSVTLRFLMILVPDRSTRTAPLSVAVHRFSDKVLTVLQRRIACHLLLFSPCKAASAARRRSSA